ncbi:MAG TPA: PqqD family protein [Chthoniobacteraceae bacterium]|nr:PqqD family protein [Chthoniobacteraceae bacterium]
MPIRINTPDVIHESFDSETVIVNLRIGVYFSLNEAGLQLWKEIGKGATEDQLASLYQAKQNVDEAAARAVVRAFLNELRDEQLIVVDAPDVLGAPVGAAPAGASLPVLRKFTDLQDLLMLDPIHEVDERGWPHAKPTGDPATGP